MTWCRSWSATCSGSGCILNEASRSTRAFPMTSGPPSRGWWRRATTRISCDMALTATLYSFDIDLADSDRGVYESLSLRAARHPSESAEYLVARVLAYCLEYT